MNKRMVIFMVCALALFFGLTYAVFFMPHSGEIKDFPDGTHFIELNFVEKLKNNLPIGAPDISYDGSIISGIRLISSGPYQGNGDTGVYRYYDIDFNDSADNIIPDMQDLSDKIRIKVSKGMLKQDKKVFDSITGGYSDIKDYSFTKKLYPANYGFNSGNAIEYLKPEQVELLNKGCRATLTATAVTQITEKTGEIFNDGKWEEIFKTSQQDTYWNLNAVFYDKDTGEVIKADIINYWPNHGYLPIEWMPSDSFDDDKKILENTLILVSENKKRMTDTTSKVYFREQWNVRAD